MTVPTPIAEEPCEDEHEWNGGYPYRECMRCGLVAEAPEPDYGDPRGDA